MSAGQSRLILVASVLGLLAVAAAAAGVAVLVTSGSTGAPGELGKWCLQLSTVFAGAGVISAVLRQAEISRAQRDAWAAMLQDLVAAHDVVQLAGRLLAAHATARTYSEQIERVSEVRVTLRRIMNAPQVHEEPGLRELVAAMRRYLKDLVQEYEEAYLPVARQQRLDEETLSHRLEELAKAADAAVLPLVPPELRVPLPAGRALNDPAVFPYLNGFRTDYKTSEFRSAYEGAKPILERKAGIRRRQPSREPAVAPPSV